MSWPVPTPRLALALVVLAAAVLVLPRYGESVAAWGLFGLIVATIVDWGLASAPRRISVSRSVPGSVTLGAQATLVWKASSRSRFRTRLRLADQLSDSLVPATRQVYLSLPPRGSREVRSTIEPQRRGRFLLERISIRTEGPLALVQRQQNRRVADTIRVVPPFRSAKDAALALRQARLQQVGLRASRLRGGGTEFDHLREMTPDDETRRIDWAATARSARPVVRTYRAEENQSVLCLLDSGRMMAGRVDAMPRFDYAIDGVMVLAELATGLGDRMGMLVFDSDVHMVLAPSTRRSQRAMVGEYLFATEPALAESDYQAMIAYVGAHYRRRHLIVLFTDLVDEVIDEYVMPALPMLTRTHLVAIIALADPDVVAMARSGRNDAEGAFHRAAALEQLERRAQLSARLKARGCLVVEAEPDGFGAAVAQFYIDIKSTGRL